MNVCPRCGREKNDGRDFCSCGEYLRWEPTQRVRAIKATVHTVEPADAEPLGSSPGGPPQHQVTLAPAGARATLRPRSPEDDSPGSTQAPARSAGTPARHAATVHLRLPERDLESDRVVATKVAAGQRTTLIGLIRNEGNVVDNYDLSVRGLAQAWWTASPSTVYLVPYGTGGSYEQEVTVELHPPRTSEAYARSGTSKSFCIRGRRAGRWRVPPQRWASHPTRISRRSSCLTGPRAA